VDLRGGFNEVLQVSASEEIAEIGEFAVGFILDWTGLVLTEVGRVYMELTINDTPTVLSTPDLFSADENGLF
jgi:hypothetical protein